MTCTKIPDARRQLPAPFGRSCRRDREEFPLNAVRISALRAAGYGVGHSVYMGTGLHITDDLYSDGCSLSSRTGVAIARRVLIILSSHLNNSRQREQVGVGNGNARSATTPGSALVRSCSRT